jgi:hypothetical protein
MTYTAYLDPKGRIYTVRASNLSGLFAPCRISKTKTLSKINSNKIFWRDTPDQAQKDLDNYAQRKGWMPVKFSEKMDNL